MKIKTLLTQLATSAKAARQWAPGRQVRSMKDFMRYAKAFEKAYAAQDWSLVADCIADDAIWTVSGIEPPIGGAFVGRDAVLSAIARSCGALDYRFDRRLPKAVEGPIPIPGGVFLRWSATYRREGLPDIELRGQEWDFFEDGKLVHHRETSDNAAEVMAFIEEHDAELRPVAGVG